MNHTVKEILEVIESIQPLDEIETAHIKDAEQWLKTTDNVFRISKPDNPPKHLVSYFVLVDKNDKTLLLIDHIKSGLWLPAGGHVEINENPVTTVKREAEEELGLNAEFITPINNKPLFITVTKTINGNIHTDVSLWYVLNGDSGIDLDFDRSEMNGYKWYTFSEVLNTDINKLDPHMHRFINKLQQHVT